METKTNEKKVRNDFERSERAQVCTSSSNRGNDLRSSPETDSMHNNQCNMRPRSKATNRKHKKNRSQKRLNSNQSEMKATDIFTVMPANEEKTEWGIVVGRSLATTKKFKTKGEALAYLDTPKWDTVLALCSELVTYEREKLEAAKMAKEINEPEPEKM